MNFVNFKKPNNPFDLDRLKDATRNMYQRKTHKAVGTTFNIIKQFGDKVLKVHTQLNQKCWYCESHSICVFFFNTDEFNEEYEVPK